MLVAIFATPKCLGKSCLEKKSCIRETKHLLTDANSSTETKKIQIVRQNLQKKKHFFLALQFYSLYKHKVSNLRPLLSITFQQGFRKSKKNWGKKTFKRSEQMKKKSVKTFFLLW